MANGYYWSVFYPQSVYFVLGYKSLLLVLLVQVNKPNLWSTEFPNVIDIVKIIISVVCVMNYNCFFICKESSGVVQAWTATIGVRYWIILCLCLYINKFQGSFVIKSHNILSTAAFLAKSFANAQYLTIIIFHFIVKCIPIQNIITVPI